MANLPAGRAVSGSTSKAKKPKTFDSPQLGLFPQATG